MVNIAQYSMAYSLYSVKAAATTAVLKKEMDMSSELASTNVSKSMNSALRSLNSTEATNPLSSSNVIDISNLKNSH